MTDTREYRAVAAETESAATAAHALPTLVVLILHVRPWPGQEHRTDAALTARARTVFATLRADTAPASAQADACLAGRGA